MCPIQIAGLGSLDPLQADIELNRPRYCSIINNSIYVKQLPDKVLIMSKKQLMDSYEHMSCGLTDKGIPISFIQKWTYCNDEISKKDSMQIYPNDLQSEILITTSCATSINLLVRYPEFAVFNAVSACPLRAP